MPMSPKLPNIISNILESYVQMWMVLYKFVGTLTGEYVTICVIISTHLRSPPQRCKDCYFKTLLGKPWNMAQ